MLVPQEGVPERYARRVLRATAVRRSAYHHRWYRRNLAVLVPLAPIALTPLPNFPIYYLGYRVWSHHHARSGADNMLRTLRARDASAHAELAAAVAALRAEGHHPASNSWAALLQDKLAAGAEQSGGSAVPAQRPGVAAGQQPQATGAQSGVAAHALPLAAIDFEHSAELAQLCRPALRCVCARFADQSAPPQMLRAAFRCDPEQRNLQCACPDDTIAWQMLQTLQRTFLRCRCCA